MPQNFEGPRVGVGAIIFNDKNQVLLIKRGNVPYKGVWTIPGGRVELGEPVKEAALREVREECHLEIELVDLLGVVDLILKNKNGTVDFHYVLIDYLAKFKSGAPRADSDATDIGWFSREQWEKLDIPSITRKMLEKAFTKIYPSEESYN
ncbi:MAG: NUDIX hydrolase [Calditrichaeota bacterium]|nr:NUDIX hydrolase [Calditrichota bacterium]